ncbi:MAG: sensor histidine kinase [Hespellia sp.]|nr:sensor histidine kinase [Hespellia sp.]
MKKIVQKFNSLKIRTKLMILLGIVGFVPIALLGTMLSINAHNTVVENRKTDMKNSLQQATSSVISQVAVCEQMIDYFVYDQNVINFVECDPNEKATRYGFYQEVCNTMNALEYQNLVMRQITIYSENISQSFGEETQPLSELAKQPWYSTVEDSKSETFTWIYDADSLCMLAIRKMPNYKDIKSYVVVKCNIQSLLQSFDQLAVESYGVTVTGTEEVWNYYEDKSLTYSKNAVDSYICVTEKIQSLGLQAVYYTPKSSIATISWKNTLDILIRIIVCIIGILFLGRLFSNYISKPIELLTKDIQNVDSDNMKVGITSTREDEIGSLIRSYNHMMKRIQELIQENYQTKISQKEFEMKALQAQINPHFLYNSLSIINWKAIEADEKEISRITLTLSSFYRTTLNRGKTMNTIRNAVENIQSYLAIQLCIHDNNFVVHYDIDENTYEYYIPALIFQPFVENALEHGLDIKEDPDHQMWIMIKQDEKDVLIDISDNGAGMSEQEAAQILNYDAKGYGVKNVNDRLRLHYGETYHIEVESVPNVKTTIHIRIPKSGKGDQGI